MGGWVHECGRVCLCMSVCIYGLVSMSMYICKHMYMYMECWDLF